MMIANATGDGVYQVVDQLGNTVVSGLKKPVILRNLVHVNDLPNEVLVTIFSNLDPIQLNKVRLVCKRWDFVMNDKQTWTNSFSLKFHTPRIFPSLSNSSNWITEYFTRLHYLKKWKKGIALHNSYQLYDSEYRSDDSYLTNFQVNNRLGRLMVFSKRFGNITSCTLKNGKAQSFIPGGITTAFEIVSHCLNPDYLLLGKMNGQVVYKNLSTANPYSTSSSTKLIRPEINEDSSPIMCIISNPGASAKYKHMDIISGSYRGSLEIRSLQGHLFKSFTLTNEIILNIASDFKKWVIINTNTHIHIIDLINLTIVKSFELGITIELGDTTSFSYYQTINESKNSLDVDFGDFNIVVCHVNTIKTYNFRDLNNILQRSLQLDNSKTIRRSTMQGVLPNRSGSSRNNNIVGSDGLLFANLLSDDSIIIWNIRSGNNEGSDIVPMTTIYPELNHGKSYHSLQHTLNVLNLPQITSISLNGLFIAVGGYSGVCRLYDVYTGLFVRDLTVKFPKTFRHMYEQVIPVSQIILNEDIDQANGIVVSGDSMQYFQFGEASLTSLNQNPKKSKRSQVNSKSLDTKNKIREQEEEYYSDIHSQNESRKLFEKFNGEEYNAEVENDDDISLAIALSESYHDSKVNSRANSQNQEDEDLQLALELSRIMHEESQNNSQVFD
ncbi:F-box ubiquitin ligase [Scheffersomyces amazonensis]|uniref:F-box ubiquitin ligase n=1 Tax=Scheffersomyces amazonensis TaxID=1078765 RepID=UPI00315CB748